MRAKSEPKVLKSAQCLSVGHVYFCLPHSVKPHEILGWEYCESDMPMGQKFGCSLFDGIPTGNVEPPSEIEPNGRINGAVAAGFPYFKMNVVGSRHIGPID